jgi:hypothetical protein
MEVVQTEAAMGMRPREQNTRCRVSYASEMGGIQNVTAHGLGLIICRRHALLATRMAQPRARQECLGH